MNFSAAFIKFCRFILPTPFSIAVILTIVIFALALAFTNNPSADTNYTAVICQFWQQGFWDLLQFAMQMMLILVLGHVLATARVVRLSLYKLARLAPSTAKAALLVSFVGIFLGLINWGLGLISGAILARFIGEEAKKDGLAINYPLIGACGYTTMLVWHGGLSGSATLKAAEAQHFLSETMGQVPLSETIFSPMNLWITLALIIIVPLSMALMGKFSNPTPINLPQETPTTTKTPENTPLFGAEKLDNSKILAVGFGSLMLLGALYNALIVPEKLSVNVLSLNFINFILFALGLIFHGSIQNFINATDEAIQGASGIMIQFPLYAGIAGIMQYSGLINIFSDFIVDISSQSSYPLYTMLSAGIVNIFVPSGGGQWAIQGPILVDAAKALEVPYSIGIMAFAYGDELTNMLQPFWALPVLAITRLKAHEILPYTIVLMILGGSIFTIGLWVFGN
jgi:short-chain fatty acids transporter